MLIKKLFFVPNFAIFMKYLFQIWSEVEFRNIKNYSQLIINKKKTLKKLTFASYITINIFLGRKLST